jgi:uncharacterized protein (TIGR03437 family)
MHKQRPAFYLPIAFILSLAALSSAQAQNFVYLNDSLSTNTVSGFAVNSSGSLSAVPGSPFATGGAAGGVSLNYFSANRIATTTVGNRLFASNDSDGSITSFTVAPSTGALTRVAGSPFLTSLGVCNAGFSMAVSPDGTRLVVGSLCTNALQSFQIASDGTLGNLGLSRLTGCAAGGKTSSLAYSPNGQFIAVADRACASVEVFAASATALPAAVAGSPFSASAGAAPISSLDISCSNSFLYGAGSPATGSGAVQAFSMSSAGALTPLAGGIYTGRSVDLQATTLTPDGRFLVASGWDSTRFSVYSVGSSGALTEIGGSPFGFGDLSPAQIAVSADGKFIYFAEDTDDPSVLPGVGVLAIDSNGLLTQVSGSPFRNTHSSQFGGNNAVAAFPPKGCAVVPAGPVFSISPTSLTFSSAVGAASAQQIATLTNTGIGNLGVSTFRVVGPSAFSVSRDCLGAVLGPNQSCPIKVTFTPTSAGTVTATVTVSGSAGSAVLNLSGTGAGTAAPALTLTNSSLAFRVAAGATSAAQSIDVKNTGTGPLVISSVVTTGAGFNTTTSCNSATVAPQNTCNISVTYTSAAGSATTGSIVISSNATPAQTTIALSAAITSPAVSFNPDGLVFSGAIGVRTPAQTLTIMNSGGGPLTISNIALANPTQPLSLDLTACFGVTLQPGNSCNISAAYTAGSLGTSYTYIVVTDNAPDSPQRTMVVLTGTAGQTPTLSVAPSSVSFPATVVGTSSPKQTLTITNTGTGPLSVTGLITSNAAVYSVFASNCPAQLAAGAKCTAQVNFHPTAAGAAASAKVTFTSNDSSAPAVTVSGSGILKSACPDADGDKLCDDWETNGVTVRVNNVDNFIDLPAMGANPNHKDIFIHTDWMFATGTGGHTHQPNVDAMNDIVTAFANAPVHNPDNNDGITMHIDCGSACPMKPGATWGKLSAASGFADAAYLYSAPPPPNSPPVTPDTWVNFDKLSANFIASGRGLIFHHAIFAHYQNSSTTSSGLSSNASGTAFDLGGSKVMVTLAGGDHSVGTRQQQAGTLMHELGHNLGLHHGSDDDDNYKPNYLSVMNYSFQFSGLTKDGGDGLLDYSRFSLSKLDETNLNELSGLGGGTEFPKYGTRWFCSKSPLQPGGVPNKKIEDATGYVDWNCDGVFRAGVSEDINGAQGVTGNNYNGTRILSTLAASRFEWDKLVFAGGALAGQGVGDDSPADTPPDEITQEVASQIEPFTQVRASYPSLLQVLPGSSTTVAVVISNRGSKPDSYSFAPNAPAGWLDSSALPATLSLQAGASATVRVTVNVPGSAAAGDSQTVSLAVQSTAYVNTHDSAQITVNVVATALPLIASTGELVLPVQAVGTTGRTAALTVTNTSGTALSLSGIAIAGDFTQTNDCGGSLAAGASCVFQVAFAPTAEGARSGMLTVSTGSPATPFVVSLRGTTGAVVAGPSVAASVSAASGQAGALAAGSLFSIYGSQLSDGTDQATQLPLPLQLAGTTVTVGGVAAPLLYVGAGQINAQVPYNLPAGPASVTVSSGDGPIAQSTIQIAAAAPGLFLIYGTSHLAAQNADYSLNAKGNGTPSGGIVVVYFTGQGAVDQPVTSGAGAPSTAPAKVVANVTATIAGLPAKVLFAGLTPGTVGLAQANLTVPLGADGKPLPAGDYPVVISVGGTLSSTGMISVQ